MLVYLQNDAVTFFGGVSFWKKKFGRTLKEERKTLCNTGAQWTRDAGL